MYSKITFHHKDIQSGCYPLCNIIGGELLCVGTQKHVYTSTVPVPLPLKTTESYTAVILQDSNDRIASMLPTVTGSVKSASIDLCAKSFQQSLFLRRFHLVNESGILYGDLIR